jgi:hypothetical protein
VPLGEAWGKLEGYFDADRNPRNFRQILSATINWGVRYEVKATSDSGNPNDLNKVTWSENIHPANESAYFKASTFEDSNDDYSSQWETGDFHTQYRPVSQSDLADYMNGENMAGEIITYQDLFNKARDSITNAISGFPGEQTQDQIQYWQFYDERTGAVCPPIATSGFLYQTKIYTETTDGVAQYVYNVKVRPEDYPNIPVTGNSSVTGGSVFPTDLTSVTVIIGPVPK